MKNITFVLVLFLLAIDWKWYKIAYKLTSYTYRKSNTLQSFIEWAEFAQYVDSKYISKEPQTSHLARVNILINSKPYTMNVIKQKAAYVSIGAKRWYVVPNSLLEC